MSRSLAGTTLAEAKRFTRWRIEDANMKRDQTRITDDERDRLVAQAWADLEAAHPQDGTPPCAIP